MSSKFFKLNHDSKTEVLLLSSPHFSRTLDQQEIAIGNSFVTSVPKAKNIGVTFDSTKSFQTHTSSVCKSCFFHLRNIGSIRKYLTTDATIKLVHAFVTSKIDYCNSLLYGLPDSQLNKLQRVLNTAARIVSLTPKFTPISHVLVSLHWLPIRKRVQFKILLITFKALNGLAPAYLSGLLSLYSPTRQLRSSEGNLLTIKRVNSTFGERAFSNSAPYLWNNLPQHIRCNSSLETFKKQIKTFLFTNDV